MVSVNPLIKNSVPSVVINDGICRTTVINPLIRPTIAATINPSRIAGTKGTPAWCAKNITNGANA
jgi:hypothetical protein